MNRNQRHLAVFRLTVCLAGGVVFTPEGLAANPPNTYRVPAPSGAPSLAPQVHANRTVTLQIRAPEAAKVELQLLPGERRALNRESDGTWRITAGPWEPEIYAYNFVVDGVRIPDPANPAAVVGRSGIFSLIDIPGEPPRFDEKQDVPHGSLHFHEFMSAVLGVCRRITIYVPPQYDREPSARFPVLYLRHGNGDLETTWSEIGRAGVILENLVVQGRAVPMIIVMPNGYPGLTGGGSSPEGIELTGRELIEEIIPLVERSYRTRAERGSRAIAGLSMGGGQSFLTGLRHPELFAWVGEFSSGVISDVDFRLDEAVPGFLAAPAAANESFRLLFLSCGTEDPRYAGQLDMVELLARHGIRHEWFSTPGSHEWKVWRHSLAELLPKLFREPGVGPPSGNPEKTP